MPDKTFHSRSLVAEMTLAQPCAHAKAGFLQRIATALVGFAVRPFRSPVGSRPPGFLHLDETILLALIDGELSKGARHQVTDHLRSCWSCRGQFRELCGRVQSYLVDREQQLPDSSGDSGRRVAELRQRLARVQENLPTL